MSLRASELSISNTILKRIKCSKCGNPIEKWMMFNTFPKGYPNKLYKYSLEEDYKSVDWGIDDWIFYTKLSKFSYRHMDKSFNPGHFRKKTFTINEYDFIYGCCNEYIQITNPHTLEKKNRQGNYGF